MPIEEINDAPSIPSLPFVYPRAFNATIRPLHRCHCNIIEDISKYLHQRRYCYVLCVWFSSRIRCNACGKFRIVFSFSIRKEECMGWCNGLSVWGQVSGEHVVRHSTLLRCIHDRQTCATDTGLHCKSKVVGKVHGAVMYTIACIYSITSDVISMGSVVVKFDSSRAASGSINTQPVVLQIWLKGWNEFGRFPFVIYRRLMIDKGKRLSLVTNNAEIVLFSMYPRMSSSSQAIFCSTLSCILYTYRKIIYCSIFEAI